MSRELFGSSAEGYNQMLIQGQAKNEIMIEMSELNEKQKTKSRLPGWIATYEDTSASIKDLQDKSTSLEFSLI
ncbi:MAG: hypothetical protein P4M11_02320 [Candidatus Pacebacteria bacterium]|nr:hypothetical protein [Candidatus Paceibacterota bacterium]